jgi:hypothetical protein
LSFQIFAITEDMRVRIDQSRQECGMAKIDYLGVRRDLYPIRRSDLNNALSFDQHDLIGQQLVGFRVKQSACANCDPVRGCCRRVWRLAVSECAGE